MIALIAIPGFLFAGGGTEETEPVVEDTPPQEVQPAETEVNQSEYSPVQQKLVDLGFQLPIEPFAAPPFELKTLENTQVSLADMKGKLVFVNFWASWCGPCKAEMPSMNTLYDALPADKFEMLAVNVNEPAGTVQNFINENGYTFPILLDETGAVSNTYEVQGIPTTWLVAPDGTVLGRLVGSIHWDTPEIMSLFEMLLEEA